MQIERTQWTGFRFEYLKIWRILQRVSKFRVRRATSAHPKSPKCKAIGYWHSKTTKSRTGVQATNQNSKLQTRLQDNFALFRFYSAWVAEAFQIAKKRRNRPKRLRRQKRQDWRRKGRTSQYQRDRFLSCRRMNRATERLLLRSFDSVSPWFDGVSLAVREISLKFLKPLQMAKLCYNSMQSGLFLIVFADPFSFRLEELLEALQVDEEAAHARSKSLIRSRVRDLNTQCHGMHCVVS